MTIFYEKGVTEGVKNLSEEESKHCVQVLRHNTGDEILVFDGNGGIHRSILTHVSKRSCTFDVIESKIQPGKEFSIHLAIAPTKNTDRMEWMVEKLCEIGVDQLTFLETSHSERRKIRTDRMEKKMISAMKQSGNPFKPQLNQLTRLEEFMKSDASEQKLIAHVSPSHDHIGKVIRPAKSVSILIGPEGDFDDLELAKAKENEYVPVSLGKNTLRTETAGFVASCFVNMLNEY